MPNQRVMALSLQPHFSAPDFFAKYSVSREPNEAPSIHADSLVNFLVVPPKKADRFSRPGDTWLQGQRGGV